MTDDAEWTNGQISDATLTMNRNWNIVTVYLIRYSQIKLYNYMLSLLFYINVLNFLQSKMLLWNELVAYLVNIIIGMIVRKYHKDSSTCVKHTPSLNNR